MVEIAKRTQTLGHEVRIITDRRNKTESDDELEGVKVERIRRKRLLLNAAELAQEANLKESDIINWHGSDTSSSFYLTHLGSRGTAKIVWTLHSGPLTLKDLEKLSFTEKLQLYKYWNNLLNSALPRSIVRKWCRKADISHIIALSNRLLDHLAERGVDMRNVTVVRSGVDTKVFKPLDQDTAREDLHLCKGDQIILYYGPLSSFRGVDTLVHAMPTIRRKTPTAKLLLLGRGKETNVKKEEGFRDLVEVRTEVLGQEEIVRYLAAADLVVLPFKFWPQVECPLTILESMAMGKAVVSTCTGAIPEIIDSGNNGILIPSGHPSWISHTCLELLRNSEARSKIGRNARKQIERFYDWDRIVGQTLDVFSRCA